MKITKKQTEILIVRFVIRKNKMRMNVVHMPEKYRDIGTIGHDETYVIRSISFPALMDLHTCYLAGTKRDLDDKAPSINYSNTLSAMVAVMHYAKIISDINNSPFTLDFKTLKCGCVELIAK